MPAFPDSLLAKRKIVLHKQFDRSKLDLTAPSSGSLSTILMVKNMWPNRLKRATCDACFFSEQHNKINS